MCFYYFKRFPFVRLFFRRFVYIRTYLRGSSLGVKAHVFKPSSGT